MHRQKLKYWDDTMLKVLTLSALECKKLQGAGLQKQRKVQHWMYLKEIQRTYVNCKIFCTLNHGYLKAQFLHLTCHMQVMAFFITISQIEWILYPYKSGCRALHHMKQHKVQRWMYLKEIQLTYVNCIILCIPNRGYLREAQFSISHATCN